MSKDSFIDGAPDGQFAVIVRTYVPGEALLDGSYTLLNVERV